MTNHFDVPGTEGLPRMQSVLETGWSQAIGMIGYPNANSFLLFRAGPMGPVVASTAFIRRSGGFRAGRWIGGGLSWEMEEH